MALRTAPTRSQLREHVLRIAACWLVIGLTVAWLVATLMSALPVWLQFMYFDTYGVLDYSELARYEELRYEVSRLEDSSPCWLLVTLPAVIAAFCCADIKREENVSYHRRFRPGKPYPFAH